MILNGLPWKRTEVDPTSEVRGGGREELPHARGRGRRLGGPTPSPRGVAARAQEGLEALSHVEGQEGQQ